MDSSVLNLKFSFANSIYVEDIMILYRQRIYKYCHWLMCKRQFIVVFENVKFVVDERRLDYEIFLWNFTEFIRLNFAENFILKFRT